MNNHDAIDNAMSLILDGHYDTALGVLWRLRRESERVPMDQEMSMTEVNASIRDSIRKIAGTDKLPPMRPIKTKRIPPNSVIKMKCPRCGAKPGKPCFGMTMPGRNAKVDTSKTIATFHTARTEHAKWSREQQIAPIIVPLDEV